MSRIIATSRDGLIVYARDHVIYPTARRAINDDRLEVLGIFTSKTPSTAGPYWIIKVDSLMGRIYNLVVRASESGEFIGSVRDIATVPWERWAGNPDRPGNYFHIDDGDHPQQYSERRQQHEERHYRQQRTLEGSQRFKRIRSIFKRRK